MMTCWDLLDETCCSCLHIFRWAFIADLTLGSNSSIYSLKLRKLSGSTCERHKNWNNSLLHYEELTPCVISDNVSLFDIWLLWLTNFTTDSASGPNWLKYLVNSAENKENQYWQYFIIFYVKFWIKVNVMVYFSYDNAQSVFFTNCIWQWTESETMLIMLWDTVRAFHTRLYAVDRADAPWFRETLIPWY